MKEEYKSYKISELVKRMEAVEKENKDLSKTNEKLQRDVKLWSSRFEDIRSKIVSEVIDNLSEEVIKQQDKFVDDARAMIAQEHKKLIKDNLSLEAINKLVKEFEATRNTTLQIMMTERLNTRFYTSYLINQNNLLVTFLSKNRNIRSEQVRTMDGIAIKNARASIVHIQDYVKTLNIPKETITKILAENEEEIDVFKNGLWSGKK